MSDSPSQQEIPDVVAYRTVGERLDAIDQKIVDSTASLSIPAAGAGVNLDTSVPGITTFSHEMIYAPSAGYVSGSTTTPFEGLTDDLLIPDLRTNIVDLEVTTGQNFGTPMTAKFTCDGPDGPQDLTGSWTVTGYDFVHVYGLTLNDDVFANLITGALVTIDSGTGTTVVQPVVLFANPSGLSPTSINIEFTPADTTPWEAGCNRLFGHASLIVEATAAP